MNNEQPPAEPVTRRDFLRMTCVGTTALGLGVSGAANSAAPAAPGPAQSGSARTHATGPYNIIFILTDQERFFRPGELPADFRLPAHERLMKHGTTFVNHRIGSCVCTSSRSVIYTGQHIQQTRMFDNTNFPWMGSM